MCRDGARGASRSALGPLRRIVSFAITRGSMATKGPPLIRVAIRPSYNQAGSFLRVGFPSHALTCDARHTQDVVVTTCEHLPGIGVWLFSPESDRSVVVAVKSCGRCGTEWGARVPALAAEVRGDEGRWIGWAEDEFRK